MDKKNMHETMNGNCKNRSSETAEAQNTNPDNSNQIYSDVLGSYTGVTQDGERPIQDADDL